MHKLIHELRRREVFRTAGFYVGGVWIAIEAASVLLPAFDAPGWVLRALIIVAAIGFPVTIALAWVYDISDKGIVVQADATDTVVLPFGGRKTDFAVIGVLTVALAFSLYLNITGGPRIVVEPETVSLLIADFDNQTGDPLFDDSLEQALNIGLEGASFITAYRRDRPLGETFTAASLEAVKNYTEAQNLAAAARYDEAIPFYEQAIAADGSFGRAYSGWALALFYLGRVDQATALWERALVEMDTMTERERYRTLGLYYVAVAGDYPKAIESYQTLVDKYPADNTGHNNLAIAYYFMLDFEKSMESAAKGLAIYPTNKTVKSNYALFAMLAGDFDTAVKNAEELLAEDAGLWKAWMPIAMARLASADIAGAEQAYDSMAKSSDRGAPFANLGLADIALFNGDYAKAVELLEVGVSGDSLSGNKRLLGRKYIALAEARSGLGDAEGAREAIRNGLVAHQGNGQLVPAALISLELGDTEYAANIADELSQELQPSARSFSRVITGAIATQEGRHADAVDALRSGIELLDSWLLRFYLGRAYFEAGRYVEARDEFEICLSRRGEATAMFQEDDEPTWRYMAQLDAWLTKSREKLGMGTSMH